LDHVPVDAVSVLETCAVPVIVGTAVFTGAGEDADWTTPVAADVALPDPLAFVAVTTTSIVPPTSEDCTVYEFEVAPAMFEHEAPKTLQSCH
jgi:hypothetical protein